VERDSPLSTDVKT